VIASRSCCCLRACASGWPRLLRVVCDAGGARRASLARSSAPRLRLTPPRSSSTAGRRRPRGRCAPDRMRSMPAGLRPMSYRLPFRKRSSRAPPTCRARRTLRRSRADHPRPTGQHPRRPSARHVSHRLGPRSRPTSLETRRTPCPDTAPCAHAARAAVRATPWADRLTSREAFVCQVGRRRPVQRAGALIVSPVAGLGARPRIARGPVRRMCGPQPEPKQVPDVRPLNL
jgi:hypothetical protein